MKERPILFSEPMVRAILEGRKTQTRRIVKPQPDYVLSHGYPIWLEVTTGKKKIDCPYGKIGYRLWVRETHAKNEVMPIEDRAEGDWIYRADLNDHGVSKWAARWTPSIFMPRWASRITLEITGIRVELLQDISEKGAIAEGLRDDNGAWSIELANGIGISRCVDPRRTYEDLWESINGYGSWDVNPWVWVVEFKRLEG